MATLYQEDVFNAGDGKTVTLTFFGHASFMIVYGTTVIHVDPAEEYADYSKLPKADLILVTHGHFDHFNPAAIARVRTAQTQIVVSAVCAKKLSGAIVLGNGEGKIVQGIRIEAVPAYNIKHMRSAGIPFHPRGEGNGYLVSLGKLLLYAAGDTENTPEMKALKNIDIAFLPMNLPYTMTPEMAAEAARAFRPKVLYPYHFGDTDASRLSALLASCRDIDVRIRKMS